MTNLHKTANLRDKQLARIRIKNKLYGGRARCEQFRLSLIWEIQSVTPDRIVARYLGTVEAVTMEVTL